MMFETNTDTMGFHLSKNEALTVKSLDMPSQMMNNTDKSVGSDNERRSSSNSEDNNNMFTKFAFPFKLHSILESAGTAGQESIISWLPSGKAFKIHKPKEFADAIMPQYFNQTKYRSFQRQLYIYGFDRVKDKSSEDYGAYFHELFIRGASDLCLDMQRKKIKGTGLSNEERRKKASVSRNKTRQANTNTSKAPTSMTQQSLKHSSIASDSQIGNTQSMYSNTCINSLSSQLQQQTPGRLSPSNNWNGSSTAAVLKSALQVQEFAVRQENISSMQNRVNTQASNMKNNITAAQLPQINKLLKMGRRCSLGFVRGMGRRGSLLFDGDEVIFGDKKFHFTDKY